ncbi:AAA family ATPase [Ancylobacter pratisalsi]|uniref:DNA-binding protein n=1 Tax=Ancylobacter pratisalsi TaxID=1745854 RepID=A0A6P1YLN5_9HYPH|nr:DNA-binding protein [Ancylobacter pratisalsi]QIB33601.1 DNA-binding protein [Ancylobacter pratisalsi]
MKIAALRLYNVKRFARRGVAIEGIGDGVNVLCAANEHGKSTSFDALHALFFQSHMGLPRDVRRLQPYSGGNPLVEADILVPEGRFRLTKQFIGGRRATVTDLGTGRLVAQADEAERFIAGLIRGGTAGPAGLLWVRQGNTGLEKRKEDEDERQVRESLLTSVQGEVEAITGGRRMSQIIEACNAELGALVTATGKPKAGGPYAAAIEELERFTGEEVRLKAEVDALREALDQRTGVLKRLTECENADDKTARRSAIAEAEAAFEVAKNHAESLKAARAETALARSRFEAAGRDFRAFREALERVTVLQQERETARERRDATQHRRNAASRAVEEARAEVEAAESEERRAGELLSALDAAQKARQAALELDALRQRLERAEAIRTREEECEAELASITLPAGSIKRLQALELDIARLRAAEEAGRPSLRIAYAPGSQTRVIIDGQEWPDGDERMVRDVARLDLPGIGTLSVHANRPVDADGALKRAEQARATLLAEIGVSSLDDAHRRQEAATAKAAELDQLRFEKKHLVPEGLKALREEISRRAALPEALLELTGDPQEVRELLARAAQRVGAARNRAHEAQPERERAIDALMSAQASLAAIESELSRLEASLGPEGERQTREAGLAAAFAEMEAELRSRETRSQVLEARAPDLVTAEAVLRRVKSVDEAANRQEAQLRVTLAGLTGQIRTRADDAVEEAWREAREAREAAASRVSAFETEVAVLGRLREALQASRSAARDLYLQPVLAELRPLLHLLFDDISIVFDEKTLLPQTIRRNGQDEEVDRLSGGMREQLSVLTRLAFARLLAQDGRPAPVILDDALVYSDDDRIERMFNALHRQALSQQIIVFSCRQRAFARLGGNVLHMTDWEPTLG